MFDVSCANDRNRHNFSSYNVRYILNRYIDKNHKRTICSIFPILIIDVHTTHATHTFSYVNVCQMDSVR